MERFLNGNRLGRHSTPMGNVELLPHEGKASHERFQQVFLKLPQGKETDVVIPEAFFANMAMWCWQSETTV